MLKKVRKWIYNLLSYPLMDCFDLGPAWPADVCAAKTWKNIQISPPKDTKE